jgi:hypothetical protein
MTNPTTHRRAYRPVARALAYEDTPANDVPAEVVIPEDLTTLDDAALDALHSQAVAAFQGLQEAEVTRETLDAMSALAEGIDSLAADQTRRSEERAALAAEAEALAARVGTLATAPETPAEVPVEEAPADAEVPAESVTASAAGVRRISLPAVTARRTARSAAPAPRADERDPSLPRMFAATEGFGLVNGAEVDFSSASRAVAQRLSGFNKASFDSARATGRRLRQQHNLLTVHKQFSDDLIVRSDSVEEAQRVLDRAMDETRLPGGSLTASGGWCAPSETIYDLCELESRDGLLSIPEINLARGGLRYTQGPDYASIYADTGFCYTEAEDIAGDYDGLGGGAKPCFHVDCPDFLEERMGLCGVCLTAGLLQARGYPEMIARTMRGSLIGHEHRVNANVISQMINGGTATTGHTGSTAITMPASQVGATAPVLTAIELQVEHMRHLHRMSRTTTLEAVFPYWVRGVIRSDLSRRLGLAEFDVSDQRINAWFVQRGIAAQFVYDWQDIATTAASGFTQWPTTVSFLLYPAGTWVKGTSAIISLDTIYDSALLGTNDYTALFTEEGYSTIKMCHDSRVVTVNICPDGATHAGVAIDCDGSEGA